MSAAARYALTLCIRNMAGAPSTSRAAKTHTPSHSVRLAENRAAPFLESSAFVRWHAGLLYQMVETARHLQGSAVESDRAMAANAVAELVSVSFMRGKVRAGREFPARLQRRA